MKKVMLVFGTRPEAIKMAPIIHELEKHPSRVKPIIVVTAQHREMLDQVLEIFKISPDHDLDIMSSNQSLAQVTSRILQKLDEIMIREEPDFLLVQGDTNTTMTASLAAFYRKVPVGHVEAGLRTYNRYFPFPEEINRVMTSHLSSYHYAPTEQARENLLREGIEENHVLVTGNTVIDSLLKIVRRENGEDQNKNSFRRILVTAHRRESFGQPLEEICRALLDIVTMHADVRVLFPVHPNPQVQSTVQSHLSRHPQIDLVQPLSYDEFARSLAGCHLVLTDSGGIQEEAPSLGKPVLVLRNETERREGVEAGTCRLVGQDRKNIVDEVNELLTNEVAYRQMAQAVNPYGDGKASQRIVEHILSILYSN